MPENIRKLLMQNIHYVVGAIFALFAGIMIMGQFSGDDQGPAAQRSSGVERLPSQSGDYFAQSGEVSGNANTAGPAGAQSSTDGLRFDAPPPRNVDTDSIPGLPKQEVNIRGMAETSEILDAIARLDFRMREMDSRAGQIEEAVVELGRRTNNLARRSNDSTGASGGDAQMDPAIYEILDRLFVQVDDLTIQVERLTEHAVALEQSVEDRLEEIEDLTQRRGSSSSAGRSSTQQPSSTSITPSNLSPSQTRPASGASQQSANRPSVTTPARQPEASGTPNYVLRSAAKGVAWITDRNTNTTRRIHPLDVVPTLGEIVEIRRVGGKWEVIGSEKTLKEHP